MMHSIPARRTKTRINVVMMLLMMISVALGRWGAASAFAPSQQFKATLPVNSACSLLKISNNNNSLLFSPLWRSSTATSLVNNNLQRRHLQLLHAQDKANFEDGEEEVEDRGDEMVIRRPKLDTLVEAVSFRIRRLSWLSWWSQVILTTVASVTLLFTRNVLESQAATSSAAAAVTINRNLLPNYFLAGSSIALGFVSIFWTWATRRLSRRLLRKPTTRIQTANMLRKDIHVGAVLNLLGMAFALLGAEQIVGGLAIKVLTTASSSTPAVYQGAQSLSLLQPLDILVVQANTNTLFSHFCSLVAYLWLGRSIDKLDPPSRDDSRRNG